MLRSLLMLCVLLAVALPAARCVADQPASSATPAPSSPPTALCTAFLTGVLAGKLPATGLTDAMKTALTPQALAQVAGLFAPLGAFRTLQFVRQESAGGFTHYHYVAVFQMGTQPLVFTVDSSGNIAGFFKDPPQ
jgi:hypothetical protein